MFRHTHTECREDLCFIQCHKVMSVYEREEETNVKAIEGQVNQSAFIRAAALNHVHSRLIAICSIRSKATELKWDWMENLHASKEGKTPQPDASDWLNGGKYNVSYEYTSQR